MPNSSGKSDSPRRVHPPFAQPDPGRRGTPTHTKSFNTEPFHTGGFNTEGLNAGESYSEATEVGRTPLETLPDIEAFLDELPMIDDFIDSEGWADADWQSYDWSGLSALGAPASEAVEANAAWSSTSWDSAARKAGIVPGRPGRMIEEEVAEALDEIARTIRSGELSLEQFRGIPPEAAIAAVFAALLRSRG